MINGGPEVEELQKAVEFARAKHRGQKDLNSEDYFLVHLRGVARGVESNKEKTVAYLHDIVEDTDVTIEEIYIMFSSDVAKAVDLLTKTPGIDYQVYLERIKENDLARAVKLSDLRNNTSPSRLAKRELKERDLKRLEKYRKAIEFLK